MLTTTSDRLLFFQRTSDFYLAEKQRARAAGKWLPYQLEDLRSLLEKRLLQGACPACRGPLTASAFAIEHKVPLNRGGKFILRNLEIYCPDCHSIKGVLDDQELRELLLMVASWPKPVSKNFLRRQRAGAALVPACLPPLDSLEWFTGIPESSAEAPLLRKRPG